MDGFDWNKGNVEKNWLKHKVSVKECEEVFFNKPLVSFKDIQHSRIEKRFIIIGMSDSGRVLHIVYTVRNEKVRIISARSANKKERRLYENTKSKK